VNIALALVFSLIARLMVCGNAAALEANPDTSFDNRTLQLRF